MSRLRQYGTPELLEQTEGPLTAPVVRSTAFAMASAEDLRAVMTGEAWGEVYPRYGHVAGRAFEARMAVLEGADGAVSFASGMAALTAIVLGLVDAGEAVAVSRHVYGGLDALLTHDVPRLGIDVRRFDPFVAGELEAVLVDGGVRVVHIETPTNPLCRVVDVAAAAAAAHARGALLTVDATFQPPPLQRPLAHGADLVMHSATKVLGGHSDALGGVVSGRHELLERINGFRRRAGAVLSPDTAWLFARSVATVELRARRMAATAARLAAYLDGVRREGGPVRHVHYPGLPGHPEAELADRQMATPGFMFAVEVDGGLDGAVEVYDRFRVIRRAVSLGGTETIASLPAHTSHSYISAEDRAAAGISDGLIRVSVGLEPAEELEEDLAQALSLGSDSRPARRASVVR